jgi:hypothetical protein
LVFKPECRVQVRGARSSRPVFACSRFLNFQKLHRNPMPEPKFQKAFAALLVMREEIASRELSGTAARLRRLFLGGTTGGWARRSAPGWSGGCWTARRTAQARASSVQQQDPTDQRGPSRQRHNVDQLATAPRPVSTVPCEVMHRIGFIRISLDCRHGYTPKVPPRRHVKFG